MFTPQEVLILLGIELTSGKRGAYTHAEKRRIQKILKPHIKEIPPEFIGFYEGLLDEIKSLGTPHSSPL